MILHIIESIEEEASGPSYTVPSLCEAVARLGEEVVLLTVGQSMTRVGWSHKAYPQSFEHVPFLRRLRFSRGLVRAARERAVEADVVHVHGLWRMPSVYAARAAMQAKKPLIISPRGMLGGAALNFSAAQKRAFWALVQGKAVQTARCIHATSEQECRDVRAFGLNTPVAIVPNGIHVPPSIRRFRSPGQRRTVLYLGRIHPKKGLGDLVQAWARVAERHPSWQLDIVGPAEGEHANELRRTIAPLSRIRLVGPLYGREKIAAYRNADVFVLPTLNENFGMTVAEALAQGTPVISTKGAPWEGLETHRCGWWIDHGVGSLAAALDRTMQMDAAHLAEMGEAGRRWMEADFDWATVASTMRSVYRWLATGGTPPNCVVS